MAQDDAAMSDFDDKGVILNLTTSDFGGAGRGAFDLHLRFQEMGYDSHMVVLKKTVSDPFVHEMSAWRRGIRKLKRALSPRGGMHPKYQFYSLDEKTCYVSAKEILKAVPARPDIINVFWTATFVNTKLVRTLHERTGAEIVWHLPDMAAFTGGCHFSMGCVGYETGCLQCPAVADSRRAGLPAENLARKCANLEKVPVNVVAGTRDILRKATASKVFANRPAHLLGFYCDESLFRASAAEFDGSRARMLEAFSLQIPQDALIAIVGATCFGQRRKGAIELGAALRAYSAHVSEGTPAIHVVAVGGRLPLEWSNDVVRIHHVSQVTMKQLAVIYCGVDFMINPVVDDIGPFMVIEAMYCGRPVISFPVGIANDIVRDGETGMMADGFGGEELASAIRRFTSLPAVQREEIGIAARQAALTFFNWDDRRNGYADLLADLVKRATGNRLVR
jgi:glycosyltransferase involved in cell wall biosynthesis